MSQRTRILIALVVLAAVAGVVLGLDALQRARVGSVRTAAGEPTLVPGGVPIYVDGRLVGSFSPSDLERLEQASFTEPEENKLQQGWLLRDVIRLYVDADNLDPTALVTVSSSSRDKSAQLAWAEVDDPANMVMFDLSNRGTLKLVSQLASLDSRDEWVQDADRIEIVTP